MAGGRDRSPPWGWWLRLEGSDFHDGEGGCWQSVRDAFWHGHLGMPDVHYAAEQQELLLRVLASIDQRGTLRATPVIDLFGGDSMMWRFYLCWLASIGMLEQPESRVSFSPSSPLEAGLSEEGRSVLLMLQLTREPEWEHLPMREVVEAVARSGWNLEDQVREDALQAFERSVGRRRWTFAREHLPGSFLVTLTGFSAHARMPTMAVMWSVRFAEARPRDHLFAWLATHVDRWDEWGERAYGSGADAFTRHLLSLLVADAGPVT
jgi:hypothetical protein